MTTNTVGIRKPGKTERDHASEAWARRFENHEKRKEWDRETTAKSVPTKRHFPIEVCNGKATQALRNVHICGRRAVPGQKGGGPCRHKRGKKA